MEPIAVYRRTIRASLERIWENVLDWEHLPWLHRESFLGVELLEQRGGDGFRAWVRMPPAERPRRSLLDVELHRDERFYWTRTLEGTGAGSGIRTSLTPVEDHATEICVEFFAAGAPRPEVVPRLGGAYLELYEKLWDQDEEMMRRRQAVLDARRGRGEWSPLELGAIDDLRHRLPLTVETASGPVRLVEVGGEIVVHTTVCPHLGGPLDGDVCAGVVTCPWHGYRFDVRSGASADGRKLRLPPPPRLVVEAGRARLL